MAAVDADEVEVTVPTAVGNLLGTIRLRHEPRSLPGVVLVDGSGDGGRDDWGRWPRWISEAGAVVLRHDKPGCGGSPGDWTEQSLEDRARESLAAVAVLRSHPSVAGQPVGLYGMSQGGWVALIAASIGSDVEFVICHSGPAVSPLEQERTRIEQALRSKGTADGDVHVAMAWVDERSRRLRAGDRVTDVLEAQAAFEGASWFGTVSESYDEPRALAFVARLLDFDPVNVLPSVTCPTLALFGASDTIVDAQSNIAAFAAHLPRSVHNGFAVFPGADHGLYCDSEDLTAPHPPRLAPAYQATVAAFLADRRRTAA